MDKEKIIQVIFDAIAEVNQQLPQEQKLEQSIGTPLAGDQGRLDSLGLVVFIVAVERLATERLGREIVLTNDETMSRQEAVFTSVATLADHLENLMSLRCDD